MFCRKCGNKIEEDSQYCKYCGANVSDNDKKINHRTLTTRIRDYYTSFLSFPKKLQVCILCYGLWVLFWLCLAISKADEIGNRHSSYYENVAFPSLLAIIGLPFLIFTIYHIHKIFKTNTIQKSTIDNDTIGNTPKSINTTIVEPIIRPKMINIDSNEVFEKFTLREFALLYGKMQVKVETINSNTKEAYCTFTNNSNIATTVYFDPAMGVLTASEICTNRDNLLILELKNKVYIISDHE